MAAGHHGQGVFGVSFGVIRFGHVVGPIGAAYRITDVKMFA